MAASTYRIYGLGVAVDRPIPRLSGAPPAAQADLTITLGSMPEWRDAAVAPSAEPWYERRDPTSTGPPLVAIWTLASGHIRLRYYEGVEFLIAPDGDRLWATWPASLTIDDISPYLLGPVLGFVLRLRGTTCLHASAIAIGGRAAVFIGDRGAGKSTTAAALLARGNRVMSDDIVPLADLDGTWMVQPGYPCLRLWPKSINALVSGHAAFSAVPDQPLDDSYHINLVEHRGSFQADPLPLGAIYVLEPRSTDAGAPCIAAAPPAQAFMDLVGNTFANKLLDTAGRAREFDELSRLTARVPVRRVQPHADLARLARLCDLVLADFGRRCAAPHTDATFV